MRRLGLSGWILVGLVAGVMCGLFFGEACASLKVFGDAFIGLLQMTVLPYIALSLVGGIGSLDFDKARSLGGTALAVVLMLWGLGFAAVVIFPLALPTMRTASFFSTSLVEARPSFDFLGLFIPSNPFRSFANNQVPAVVLFCILTGVAVVTLQNKEELLRLVGLMSQTMARVTKLVVHASPLGVFSSWQPPPGR